MGRVCVCVSARFSQCIALVVFQRLTVGTAPGVFILRDFESRGVLIRIKVLDHALTDQKDGEDEGKRQQYVERDARQIHPGVAKGLGGVAREAADQGNGDDDAGSGREKILHRETQHLGKVAHGGLAGIALPIGIGGETDGRVEGRIRTDAGHCLRIEGQPDL
jgi:hypothetical protein